MTNPLEHMSIDKLQRMHEHARIQAEQTAEYMALLQAEIARRLGNTAIEGSESDE